MKTLRLLMFLNAYFFSYQTFSQTDTHNNEAYKNVGDFKNNSPLCVFYFKADKVNRSYVPELYTITSMDNTVSDGYVLERCGINNFKYSSSIPL